MKFSVRPINLDCTAIDDEAGQTVAIVTPQGWVDWLLREPGQPGERVTAIDKETHLGNVRGLKFNLHIQKPMTVNVTPPRVDVVDNGRKVVVVGESARPDRTVSGEHRAELTVSAETGRYEWRHDTVMTRTASDPLRTFYIEYNNILPASTGGRFLCERTKKFDRCLSRDRDGVIWEFPHQHVLDYWLIGRPGQKKLPLPQSGGPGCWGGFFGEAFNPIVTLESGDGEPCWGICDAYYDFHCCTRHPDPLLPGKSWRWRYRIHYLSAAEAKPLMANVRRMPVSEADWKARGGARFGLGFNDFRNSARIDGFDEASAFIPDRPNFSWDRSGGPDGNGVIRMVSSGPGELIWQAAVRCPTQMPAANRLRIRGKMRVEGAGRMFFRLRPHIYDWRPQPHVDWLPPVCSKPVGDTAGTWVDFEVPAFERTASQVDTELEIELVFEGAGTGCISSLDVSLEPLGGR